MFKRVSHLICEMTRVLIKAEFFSIKQSIRWDIRKFQHQRRQPQRLHHELRILLVEQGKNKRAARAACILQQFRVVLCKTTT